MSPPRRSTDWGFPRWRGYGTASQDAVKVRLCDRHNCPEPGNCPAPKAPNSPERWYFCQQHAAEYNSKWDYFEGLEKEEAEARAGAEQRSNAGYTASAHYGWAGSGDGSRTADEMRALDILELENDADMEAIKKAWRAKARKYHPDVNPDDKEAARMFQACQLAYEILRQAEERREWQG
jgi:hypothetical protein